MPTRNLSLAAPFVVLALVIGGFTLTPRWIQRHGAELREPAFAELASSVRDLGELVEMRAQLHRAIAQADDGGGGDLEGALRDLRAAFLRYSAAQSPPPSQLADALGRFERDAPGTDVREAHRSGGRLSDLLMDELAARTRRASDASERVEEIRGRSLRLVTALDLLWALVALVGGVVAAVLVHRHQRVVEQLRRLEQARASELEQFAGRVAHDIVSPLAPVSPSLQVLSHKLDSDHAAQKAVGAIRRSLDRVSMIVDELLRFARSGAQPAPGERADIARVLESVRDELTPDAEQSGVTLRFEPAPQVEVACAEGAMLVVIHNLVRNAIKYIGDGPRRLVVTRAVVAAQSVRLSVQDSGPGLPAGMEQAVFAPYVRAPGTRAPGIGLGLATVKRIVESRRGRVGVWSEPRKGATFWVDLPLAPVERTAALRRGSRLWVAALAPLAAGWTVAAQAKEVPSAGLHACPKSRLRPLAGDHAPPTLPPGIPVAKSVAKSDTSTSIVIEANGPQIQCGKTEVETHHDIVYSTPPTAENKPLELKMDILVPKTGGKKPLVVWFPGGGFLFALKEGSLDHRTYVAEAGYVVASIQYRTLANGATYKEGVVDAKSAIRYLRAHADQYEIDPGKVAAWGESAGGYVAAMVGTTDGIKQFDVGDNLDQSGGVQAVIDQFGPSDLSKIAADFDPADQRVLLSPGGLTAQWVYGPGIQKSVSDDPRAIARANPATYIASSDPAFLLFHGTADKLVSPSQTLLVHNALRAKGVESTRYLLRGAGHGDVSFMGDAKAGSPWSTEEVMGLIVTFLGRHLRS